MVLALLPVTVLEVYTLSQARRASAQEVENSATRLVRALAARQTTVLEAARQIVVTLVQGPTIRSGPSPASEGFLRRLLDLGPAYANFALVDAEGKIVASALEGQKGKAGLGKLAAEALEKRTFVFGEDQGNATPGFSLVLLYPVPEEGGERSRHVALIAMNFSAEGSYPGHQLNLPESGRLSVISDTGTILYLNPDPTGRVGTRADISAIDRAFPVGTREAVFFHQRQGEELRVLAMERIALDGGRHLDVGVSIDPEAGGFPLQSRWKWHLAALTGFSLLALLGAWVIGSRLMVRPARELASAARTIAGGDLTHRVDLLRHRGEFGEIARTFNQMADSLSGRIADLDAAQSALQNAKGELAVEVEERTRQWRTARDRLVDAIETLEEGFVMFGPDQRMVLRNQSFLRLFGLNPEVIRPGLRYEEVVDEFLATGSRMEDVDDFKAWKEERMRKYTQSGEQVEMERVGGRWVRYSHHKTREGGVVFLCTDMTRQVEAKEKLEQTAEELRRSNRDLEQFAYIASHDLQEPLRMVASYTQLLSRRYSGQLDDKAREYIHYAVDGARRMQGFITDLLEYSRVSTHGRPFVPIETERLVGEVLETLHWSLQEHDAKVEVGHLPAVHGDPVQITQLFQNLLSNALKFGGEPPVHITISGRVEGNDLLFCVADDGIGIAKDDLERVFVMFARLHPRETYEGSGIGLPICQKIVERHGGRIWVESERGEGSRFFFTLARPSPKSQN